MKRGWILLIVLISFILVPMVFADEQSQVDKAYSCLNQKINSSGCDSLSFEEQSFSLLAAGQCYPQVLSANSSGECWPKGSCNIKQTAQGLLSIKSYNENYNTSAGESWLLNHKTIPQGMQWFLEIESNEATSCKLYYDGNEQGTPITIAADKKISASNLGSCFSLPPEKENYLLEVDPSCYNMNLDISCDKSFITTLLFQKKDSSTINILDQVHSAAPQGTTTEKINSWCFSNPSSGTCDYEGSLWASEVLFYLGQDVSPFIPYLVAFSEQNEKFVPESFLYYLTGKFRNELLFGQVRNSYWINSGDEYYDTAVALLPLQYESPIEKQNSKNWLLDKQETSGCWDNGNLRNTAFILYSVWPRDFSLPPNNGGGNGGGNETPTQTCGNGIIEGTEQCDGTNLGGNTLCSDIKGSNWDGNVSCYPAGNTYECQYNLSQCTSTVEPPECQTDEDCADGLKCVDGNCLQPSENGSSISPECSTNLDCLGSNEECTNGYCTEKVLGCEDEGYFCMSPVDCGSGRLLGEYSCNTPFKCCEEQKSFGTCKSQDGEICSPTEYCSGTETTADSLLSGEVCCIGTCKTSSSGNKPNNSGGSDVSLCENNDGTCRVSCLSDEDSSEFYTCDFGDVCCIPSQPKKKSTWFIWLLLGLILLAVIGIVFREKIKEAYFKFKNKLNKKKKDSKRPPFGLGSRLPRRPLPHHPAGPPRRILPPSQKSEPPKPSPQKPSTPKKKNRPKDLDEVLRKLRELGNK